MTDKSMAKADFITSLTLLAFGIAIVVLSIQMPMATDANQSKFSAPGIVPGFIGAMLSLLSFAMLLRSIRHGGASGLAPKPGAVKRLFAQETTARILKTTGLCAPSRSLHNRACTAIGEGAGINRSLSSGRYPST